MRSPRASLGASRPSLARAPPSPPIVADAAPADTKTTKIAASLSDLSFALLVKLSPGLTLSARTTLFFRVGPGLAAAATIGHVIVQHTLLASVDVRYPALVMGSGCAVHPGIASRDGRGLGVRRHSTVGKGFSPS